MKILRKIRLFPQKKENCSSIYTQEKFIEVLKRERLKTHRYGTTFSLIIFDATADSEKYKIFDDLVKVLLERVRATDEIGWYSNDRIGLFLPGTPPECAKKLADEILFKNSKDKQLVYEIDYYPKEKNSNGHKDLNNSSDCQCEKIIPENDKDMFVLEHSKIDEILASPMPAWKRCLDIFFSGFGLIIFFPVFLFIGILIKIVSPGPILFKQTRVGFHKKPFNCLKFRTMEVNADTSIHKNHLQALMRNDCEEMVKLDNQDNRIIPFGRILRKSGFDELPQLINILLGDMSLVGPRPCTLYEASEYRSWQHRRFDAKPGLTGLWQVSGKNKTSFIEMIRLDIRYSIKRGLLNDLWILIRTFPAVFDQVFDRLPPKKNETKTGKYEKSYKNRSGWLRILGSKSHSKF